VPGWSVPVVFETFGPLNSTLSTRLSPPSSIQESVENRLPRQRPQRSATRFVISRLLMDSLWPKTFVSESHLASLLNDLRVALGDDARRPTWIRTVYGFGYAFMGGRVPAQVAAPSFARHRLLWAGREVGLREGVTALGRDASADVLVVDGSVSRRHARIEVQAERATLEDLGSKNGRFHAQIRIMSPVMLSDGDEIRLGSVLLRFVSASPDGSTLTRA
jgi:hypothetical protein